MPQDGLGKYLRRPPPYGQRSGTVGAIARFWKRSNAADYIGLALLLAGYALIELFITPFHRLFTLSDPAKSYPHALHEHVPPYSLLILSIALPLGLILLVLACSPRVPSILKTHLTILSLAISLALTAFLTDVLKNTVGRPRPDLISRCKPRKGTYPSRLVGIDVCTEKNHHLLHDGWRSFPSGHSSFSFAGLGYLSLFLAGHLRVFIRRRSRGSRGTPSLILVLVALAPLLGAVLIAISRLEDYRHDIWDVSAGSILGLSMAFYSYRRYFPSPWSRGAGEPYDAVHEHEVSRLGRWQREDEEAVVRDAEDFELDELVENKHENEGDSDGEMSGRQVHREERQPLNATGTGIT